MCHYWYSSPPVHKLEAWTPSSNTWASILTFQTSSIPRIIQFCWMLYSCLTISVRFFNEAWSSEDAADSSSRCYQLKGHDLITTLHLVRTIQSFFCFPTRRRCLLVIRLFHWLCGNQKSVRLQDLRHEPTVPIGQIGASYLSNHPPSTHSSHYDMVLRCVQSRVRAYKLILSLIADEILC